MYKDFFANSRTALGRLLTVATVISLSACGSHNPYYGQMSTASNYSAPESIYSVVFNLGKHTAYSVPAEDRQRHERCVYFALDTLPPGQSCKWYGNNTNASGEVFVARVDPNTCTTLMSTVWYKGNSKNFTDRACLKGNQWKFFKN